MKQYEIKCSSCGKSREFTESSYYEAKRLDKTVCRSCAQKQRPNRVSKYNDKIKHGDVFRKWTVIGDVIKDGGLIKCECECGYISTVKINRLLNGTTNGCRKCTVVGSGSGNWRGHGEIPATVITKIKNRAHKRGYEYNVDGHYLMELYKIQGKKCALTGIDIDFIPRDGYNIANGHMSASLDRIDSSRGYIKGNVQWVYTKINMMKQAYTQREFIELCKSVVDYDKNRVI